MKMGTMLITFDDILEVLHKKCMLKNSRESIDDLTKAEIESFILESEIARFSDIFNNLFENEILPLEKNTDCVDGKGEEICIKIVESVKESLKKIDREKLLKVLFKLISKIIFSDIED